MRQNIAARAAAVAFLCLQIAVLPTVLGADGSSGTANAWKAAWTASPHAIVTFGNRPPPASLANVTLRQRVHASVGGTQVRVRLSNEYGSEPLVIGTAAMTAGKSKEIHPLTFGGEPSITIPAGAPALSDPVDIKVAADQELAISIYLPEKTDPNTLHFTGLATMEISQPGDFTLAAELPVADSNEMRYFVSGVNVLNPDAGVIVAFGDSITDGMGSKANTNQRWPDLLAQRLRARRDMAKGKYREMAVANQGISGNQLLKTRMGESALIRFDRDVLAVPGVTHVVVMLGINDIGTPGASFGGRSLESEASGPKVTDLIAGYRQLIARAREHGLRIYGATLTPFEGTGGGYYTPQKEKLRQAVNSWIRSSNAFDAVIDFDAAVRDPQKRGRLKEKYDSGDHLHPSSAGYMAMAVAIDLSLFD